MNSYRPYLLLIVLLLTSCASAPPDSPRIAELHARPFAMPSVEPTAVAPNAALQAYRDFVKTAPESPAYREALRRTADMELETAELTKPSTAQSAADRPDIEASISHYLEYLARYPGDENTEGILYQLAKAYDLGGQLEKSLATLERLLHNHPGGVYSQEALFRAGEMNFTLRDHIAAETAFKTIVDEYPNSLYYERSLYMLGWSIYLQNRFDDALQAFYTLLDRKQNDFTLSEAAIKDSTPPGDRELLEDSLKVITLSLSYQENKRSIDAGFERHGHRPYESIIYRRLGEFYLSKERFLDAAHTFMALTHRYPNHHLAPAFHQYAMQAYENGGFRDLYLAAKTSFVETYGLGHPYWLTHDEAVHQQVLAYLAVDIRDLATHYHSLARHTKKPDDYNKAVHWYREYLRSFTTGDEAAEINFMLAECLHDAGRLEEAIAEYEKSAYEYDLHKNSAEAAYAAILTYKQVQVGIQEDNRNPWRRRAIASSLRFSERFPSDSRVDSVLANAVDALYAIGDFPGTIDAAQRFLARPEHGPQAIRSNIWIVLGHARFETGDYDNAVKAYQSALNSLPENDSQRPKVVENLAASLYKQGEQKRATGDLRGAVAIFMQIETVAPAADVWINARYDAAAALIQLEDWPTAANVLEDFRNRKLGTPALQHGVTEKLALVYMKSGQKRKAAHEMETLAGLTADTTKRRELLWETAALYHESSSDKDAIRIYRRYVTDYPDDFANAMEARYQLSELYGKQGDMDESQRWLRAIITADEKAGSARTDRSRQLAGAASLAIARPLMHAYQNARLTLPLTKSLKTKKALMEKAIAAYKKALEYRVADVSTAATYQLGDIYDNFAKAIMGSDRPKGLSKDELDQYNILLEDQSYSFQEKAIQLHEANVKHIADGLYDDWIKRSLDALASLYPLRYAKVEHIEAFYDGGR